MQWPSTLGHVSKGNEVSDNRIEYKIDYTFIGMLNNFIQMKFKKIALCSYFIF